MLAKNPNGEKLVATGSGVRKVLMLLMHGNEWTGQDVSGWWLSEKFDGWRAIWTGERLESRQEKPYNPPAWFTRGLPDMPLDCELWLGRGKNHTDVAKAVRSGRWHDLRLVVFDIVAPGMSLEWSIDELSRAYTPSHVVLAKHTKCQSTNSAKREMERVKANAGEGVMLRRPWSAYQTYRTDDLLKLKP